MINKISHVGKTTIHPCKPRLFSAFDFLIVVQDGSIVGDLGLLPSGAHATSSPTANGRGVNGSPVLASRKYFIMSELIPST